MKVSPVPDLQELPSWWRKRTLVKAGGGATELWSKLPFAQNAGPFFFLEAAALTRVLLRHQQL